MKSKFYIPLPKDVESILDKLERNGYEAYVVGGCVRDALMGRDPHDWDITTNATPEEMLKVFHADPVLPTGIKHGTLTVLKHGTGYECTTYRSDGVYEDHRRPNAVVYEKDLRKDLARRDFTINAMAYNHKDGLIDPFGGAESIVRKEIVCVGNPVTRFNEDALRILRAWRFSCQLGFSIHPSVKEAMITCSPLLQDISAERIQSEFLKAINGDLESFAEQAYVLPFFIPEWNDLDTQQNHPYHFTTVMYHSLLALESLETFDRPIDTITRLAVLFHDFGKPDVKETDENQIDHFPRHGAVGADKVDAIMRRLKFDNETRTSVVTLVKEHDRTIMPTDKVIRRLLNQFGVEQLNRLLDVKEADHLAQNLEYSGKDLDEIQMVREKMQEVLEQEQCFSLKDLEIRGQDIVDNFIIDDNRKIGLTLKLLLFDVMNDLVDNDLSSLFIAAGDYLGHNYVELKEMLDSEEINSLDNQELESTDNPEIG